MTCTWKLTRPAHFRGDRAPRSPTRFPLHGRGLEIRCQAAGTPNTHTARTESPSSRQSRKETEIPSSEFRRVLSGTPLGGDQHPRSLGLNMAWVKPTGPSPKAKPTRVGEDTPCVTTRLRGGSASRPLPHAIALQPRGPGLSPTSPAEGPSAPRHRPAALFSFFFPHTRQTFRAEHVSPPHLSRSGRGPLCSALAAQVTTTGVHLPRPGPFRLPQCQRACVEGGLKPHFTLFLQAVTLPSAPAPHRLAPRPPAVRKGRGWAAEAPRRRRETGGRRVAGPAGLGSAR